MEWIDNRTDEDVWMDFVNKYKNKKFFKYKGILFSAELFKKATDLEKSLKVCMADTEKDPSDEIRCKIDYDFNLLSLLRQQAEYYKDLMDRQAYIVSKEQLRKLSPGSSLEIDRTILTVPRAQLRRISKLAKDLVNEVERLGKKLQELVLKSEEG